MLFARYLFIIITLCTGSNLFASEQCIEKKYVFDIGSGGIKVMGYKVDICKKMINKVIANDYYTLPLQKFISESKDGNIIPQEYINYGENAILALEKNNNINCKKDRCIAIATAWARNAINSNELLEKIEAQGVNVIILSQHNEGKLSFDSTVLLNNINHDQEKNLLVFDLGGGSFQLNDLDEKKDLRVFKGQYGMFNFKALVREKFPNFKNTDLQEVKDFALAEIGQKIKEDPYLLKKIKNNDTITIGVGAFMTLGMKEQLLMGEEVTVPKVEEAIGKIYGKSKKQIIKEFPDIKIEHAKDSLYSLLIIYAVMESTGISKIKIAKSSGQFNEYLALMDSELKLANN